MLTDTADLRGAEVDWQVSWENGSTGKESEEPNIDLYMTNTHSLPPSQVNHKKGSRGLTMQELKGLHHSGDVDWSLFGHTTQRADTCHQVDTAHTHTHTHTHTQAQSQMKNSGTSGERTLHYPLTWISPGRQTAPVPAPAPSLPLPSAQRASAVGVTQEPAVDYSQV